MGAEGTGETHNGPDEEERPEQHGEMEPGFPSHPGGEVLEGKGAEGEPVTGERGILEVLVHGRRSAGPVLHEVIGVGGIRLDVTSGPDEEGVVDGEGLGDEGEKDEEGEEEDEGLRRM